MNKTLLLSFLTALACAPVALFAQGPAPAPEGRQSAATLSPEDQQTLMTASRKAQKDPSVVAAIAKMQIAMKNGAAAMIAKDPTLAPLIAKAEAASSPGAPRPDFTAAEREKLRNGRHAIDGTPEADAWKQATDDYREAMRKVLAADPAVAAILAKMHPSATASGPAQPAGSPGTAASPAAH